MRHIVFLVFFLVFGAVTLIVWGVDYSGSMRVTEPVFFTREEIDDFSDGVEQVLLERDVEVAILFRTGRAREDMPEGILYTHGAFWVRSTLIDDGKEREGYAVYNLYQGDGNLSNTSGLYQDFPPDFIAGSIVNDVGLIIPSKELQGKLRELIASPRYQALHNPSYSIVSNPFNAMFQNCNEFMLDVMMAALFDTTETQELKGLAREHFEPQPVTMGPIVDFLAPIFIQDISVKDHEGPVRTATFRTMGQFLERQGALEEMLTLPLPPR